MRRAAAAGALALLSATGVLAHPAPFSYLDLRITDDGVQGSLTVHDFDAAHDVGVDPPERLQQAAVAERYRDQLTRLMASRLAILLDERPGALTWTGFETLPERQSLRMTFSIAAPRPARVRLQTVLFPYDPVHQTFVNVYEQDALRHQAILDEGRSSMDYYAGSWQGTGAVIGVFLPAGIEHIVIGPDHVLFLVGLLLLGGSLWKLATIVTAFTIGHSITLSLAALDVVTPPASLVEPVIALSIVLVGADNLLVQRERRTAPADGERSSTRQPRDIRAWIAGIFGLVHGFGFAGVLREFGLPATALGWSLFSFNLGVEIGQLSIVLIVASALAAVRRRDAFAARRLATAGSVIVMTAGAYWFIERVFLTGGGS